MASVMLCGAIDYRARVARSPVMDGEVVAGYIIHDPPEIIIKGGPLGVMRDNAMHEMLHGVAESMGIRDTLEALRPGLEEDVVKAFTKGLLSTLKHTRWTYRGRRLLPTFGEER